MVVLGRVHIPTTPTPTLITMIIIHTSMVINIRNSRVLSMSAVRNQIQNIRTNVVLIWKATNVMIITITITIT